MEVSFDDKLEYYRQIYFTHDEPIPFKRDIFLYPVKLKDYYNFYRLIGNFTIDKNEDKEVLGIKMNHLSYMFYLMEKKETGDRTFAEFVSLLEMITRKKNCFICDNENCDEESKTFEEMQEKINSVERESLLIQDQKKKEEMIYRAIEKIQVCEKCGSALRQYYCIKQEGEKKQLFIGHVEITPSEYENLRKLVCYQNMLDFDDEYVDPELKADLEEVAKLKNPSGVTPSLEKQMAAVITGSSYKYEDLKELTLRKFTMLLRIIDAKLHYMCYQEGKMSGLVQFKNEPDHWIWSSDDQKKDKFKDIMSLDQIKTKFGDDAKQQGTSFDG